MAVICDRDLCLSRRKYVVLSLGNAVGIKFRCFCRKSIFCVVLFDSNRWHETGNSRSRCPTRASAMGSSRWCSCDRSDDGVLADDALS